MRARVDLGGDAGWWSKPWEAAGDRVAPPAGTRRRGDEHLLTKTRWMCFFFTVVARVGIQRTAEAFIFRGREMDTNRTHGEYALNGWNIALSARPSKIGGRLRFEPRMRHPAKHYCSFLSQRASCPLCRVLCIFFAAPAKLSASRNVCCAVAICGGGACLHPTSRPAPGPSLVFSCSSRAALDKLELSGHVASI